MSEVVKKSWEQLKRLVNQRNGVAVLGGPGPAKGFDECCATQAGAAGEAADCAPEGREQRARVNRSTTKQGSANGRGRARVPQARRRRTSLPPGVGHDVY